LIERGEAVGVLGGSFDPVHLGHLHAAEGLRRSLALSRVLLLPAAIPPHKHAESLSPPAHRRAMLELALAGQSGLELCALELERGVVAYTIDTLRLLRGGRPPLRPIFLLGSDLLAQLPSWHSWREIVSEFDLAIVDRSRPVLERSPPELQREIAGRWIELPEVAGDVAELDPGRGGRLFHLALAPLPISASEVRRRAATGASLVDLVPPAVAAYIQRSSLYRREAAR
jgi:nicotinate-nucleotide adenylyltransferase